MSSESLTDVASVKVPTLPIDEACLRSAADRDVRALRGKIEDWSRLADLAKRYAAEGEWVFRGQSSAYPLRPKIGRHKAKRDKNNEPAPFDKDAERRIFEYFKKRCRPYIDHRPEGDLEWLAIAQHHGLPTRLLDWSESFLAAAYFAVEKTGVGGPAAIYAARIAGRASSSDDPFRVQDVVLYRPPHIAPRIAAQQGLFTVHPTPDIDFAQHDLELWLIPDKPTCFNIKRVLDSCGVNRSVLFPDVDGIAQYLEWRYKWTDIISLPEP